MTQPDTILPSLLLVVALGAPVWASDPDVRVVTTRLVEGAQRGRWEQVVTAYGQLVDADAVTPYHRLLAARALHALGRAQACDALVGELLAARPDHLEALALRAQLRAEQGDLDAARPLLLAAARAGRLVLRDLTHTPEAPLAKLLDDPTFVLELMRAVSAVDLEVADLRDPFALPVASEPPREPTVDASGVEALVARVDQALAEVVARLDAADPQGALAALQAARPDLDALQRLAPERARQRLAAAERQAEQLAPLLLSLELQRGLEDGRRLLTEMRDLVLAGRYADVAATHRRLTARVEELRRRSLPAFAAAALALESRGARLADEARLLARLDALTLTVTGIVVAEDQPARAIVNGAVVEVGSRDVLDPSGQVIPGLEVVRIAPSTVVFRLEGVQVVRPLADR